MRSQLRIIWQDFRGIWRVCGPGRAFQWLWAIARNFGECRRSGTLSAADEAMGTGPFRANLRGAKAEMIAAKAFSNIREIWVRDVYLGNGFLHIKDGDTVVDLGANTGIFSALALAHGPKVRVVSVEPNELLNAEYERNLGHAGTRPQATLMRCFLGGATPFQQEALQQSECRGVPFKTEKQFLNEAGITRIDFLKCDIEGSEFDLLTSQSRILALTQQLAIELHDEAGDRHTFIRQLQKLGFEAIVWREAPNDCIVLARRTA